MFKLSLCIPTFNRAEYVRDLLESISNSDNINEHSAKLEVCISDNASSDDTESMIKEFQITHSYINIRYHKNEKNMGPDYNIIKSVEISKGEYCWIVGSDDILREDSLRNVFQEINKSEEEKVILFTRDEYDITMKVRLGERKWAHTLERFEFNTQDRILLSYYLSHVDTLGGVLSFISSIVFNKKKWDSVMEGPSRYIGSGYAHVYKLQKMVYQGIDFIYCNYSNIKCRLGNDSIYENFVQRTMLDFRGYVMLANDVFGSDSILKNDFLKILKREHPELRIINLLTKCKKKEINEIKEHLFQCDYSKDFIEDIISNNYLWRKFILIKKILRKLRKITKYVGLGG
ncbi:MAG: glycosyltransferase family 2 protein [Fusobacteria bacterium]|nr:glycosyltransferase family 2 protein [Fusobacteriota bacterium]